MKEFTVPMALIDFIPVLLFLLACTRVDKDLAHRMTKISRTLFTFGYAIVFAAGTLKALYKLLYAIGAGDHSWMSAQFFSNQAFGFLLCGIGLTLAVTGKAKSRTYALLPVMSLVGIMIVGLGAMDASLCFLASKLRKRGALICFIASFFLCLGMGYLSSRSFDKASMNWIAEIVNIGGQGLLYAGVRMLHKAGLEKI